MKKPNLTYLLILFLTFFAISSCTRDCVLKDKTTGDFIGAYKGDRCSWAGNYFENIVIDNDSTLYQLSTQNSLIYFVFYNGKCR